MTDQEITALAREFSKEHDDSTIAYHAAKDVIRFLLRRYYLVEKESVRKEYQQAIEQGEHAHVRCHVESRAKLRLLESLFPEIAKEVEG